MNRFIFLKNISSYLQFYYYARIPTLQRWRHFRQISKINNDDNLFFENQQSFKYNVFNLGHQSSLMRFCAYTDQQIGGSSEGTLIFDRQQKCLTLKGFISDKNKDKLVNHPSIGIARTSSYKISMGIFNTISVQMKSDGLPIHIGVQVTTGMQGDLSCFGVVTSQDTQWRTYQLPIINMHIVGSQQNTNPDPNYLVPGSNTKITDSSAYDMRRVLVFQKTTKYVNIKDFNVRLLGTESAQRNVSIRNVNFVKRAYSEQFFQEYRQPFFYIVDDEDCKTDEELKIKFMKNSYRDFNVIDTGHKKFLRTNMTQNKRRKKLKI